MEGKLNPRIIGACVVGFALVAGAYTLSNFGQPRFNSQSASVVAVETTPRVAIAVADEDQNGIEDWRDEFITTEPIVIQEEIVDYEPPITLTGQLGVNFFQDYLQAKTYGEFGREQDEVITDTIDILTEQTAYELFDTPDITILAEWEEADVLTYANTVALAMTNNNVAGSEGELVILQRILNQTEPQPADLAQLEALSNAYQAMRDDTLAVPVPAFLAKQHLDLINAYNAIHKDIEAMSITIADPAFTLMRLKRYEDDATGLGYALENMYDVLLPYASLVGPDDPAILFVVFSPEFKS